MDLSTRRQRLGAAQIAVGLWMLVAALVASVTWPGPKDLERKDLASASLPVVGLVVIYLSATACFHLGIGARLRQGLGVNRNRILLLFACHVAVLLLIGKISLGDPVSPVYLTGMEVLLGVLTVSALLSVTTGVLVWFVLPTAFSRALDPPDLTEKPSGWLIWLWAALPWLHLVATLGLLYTLWQLDLQPLLLVK